MVDDLLHRHRLRGMTREEVVSLLGTPPETNYFREYAILCIGLAPVRRLHRFACARAEYRFRVVARD